MITENCHHARSSASSRSQKYGLLLVFDGFGRAAAGPEVELGAAGGGKLTRSRGLVPGSRRYLISGVHVFRWLAPVDGRCAFATWAPCIPRND